MIRIAFGFMLLIPCQLLSSQLPQELIVNGHQMILMGLKVFDGDGLLVS